ncbi:protelomerase family protein [Argonema antarcticum]|uniref:protelomerase family protein n=1 Tax=Argonema antarcticum TaxID=2942763 RepID=UPI0020112B70|nr:protelomerase family protein [Argonema antarcticum]MCL1474616.1 hypothetical protein [Argonema antarcticum A004/B2]
MTIGFGIFVLIALATANISRQDSKRGSIIDLIQELNTGNVAINMTAALQAEKRERICKYSREELEYFTLDGLRKLASSVVPNASRMRKGQLIDELVTATKALRVAIALMPDVPLEVIEANSAYANVKVEKLNNEDLVSWTHGLYREFRALVQSRWHSDGSWDEAIHGDIAGLAYRVIHWLNTQPGEQGDGGLSFLTKLRYRTHIVNILTELVETEKTAVYFKQLESCLEMLKRQIKIQIADIANQKKGLQERRVAQRKKEKETVSFKPLYELATATLTKIEQLKPRDWKRVSVSLAIVTGRRLAEIHRRATKFEYVDKSHVAFTGQLKAKGDAAFYFEKNPSYEIPVLIDASLVVKAHQWLKDNSKVVDTPDAANRRYSGDLSDFVKVLKKKWEIEHEFFTYKGLRAIYASVCNQVFNNNDTDNELYLAQILGHGRGELLRHDDIIDALTPQSYKSDFRVVDVDCVKF